MKKIFVITYLLILTFCVKSQSYVTATVQVSNPQPCTVCCTGSISATPISSLCPGAPIQIGIQSAATGTLIQWGFQNLYNLCNGIYTVVVSGMSGPPCDGIVVCYPYYPITTQISKRTQENFKGIAVYPNPANDILNIGWDIEFEKDITKAEIINSLGQLIIEEEISFKNRNASLNTNELPNGVYLLNLKSGISTSSASVSKRFVIAR
ncbi:MAG: T9SS type A sorting domain-containing protein [Bacteroidia bacterium]